MAKLDRALQRMLRSRGPEARLPVIVRYRSQPEMSASLRERVPPRRRYGLMPAVAAELSPREVEALAADPNVLNVWADLPVRAYLDASVPHVNAPQVWDAGFTGQGVGIAVLDTGIDGGHPDLAGRVRAAVDFTGQGPVDGNGHGTHVAGIAAGAGAEYRGMAPEADLYVAKVLDNSGQGMMSDVIAGLEWASQQPARVVNISLGSSEPSDGTDALSAACDIVVGQGMVVCVAAGNDGPGPGTVGSPGAARRAMTIGASTDLDRIASFSSRGPTLDGRVKPDLVLPGQGIVAPRAEGTALGSHVGEFYTNLSGTSMATPHAAGAVALLLQAYPDLNPGQELARFKAACADLGMDANVQGAGRLDVDAAYTNTAPEEPIEPAPGCLGGLVKSLLAMR
jgi:subtilisin family serine protease